MKKILGLSLVLVVMAALSSTSLPLVAMASTSDAPSAWATQEVNTAISHGLVPQSLRSNYTQATTRAEFAALAVAMYENINGEITGRRTFTDTSDVNVQKAAYIDVVMGVGNNRFDPNGTLTREQAAVMLVRLSDTMGHSFSRQAPTFADNAQVSSWAVEGVGRAQAAGIMGGVGNNMFSPQGSYTREQSIVTIARTFNAVVGDSLTGVEGEGMVDHPDQVGNFNKE